MPRRAQTSTPPKPASDILANATNSAIRPGGVEAGISGAGMAAGGESGSMTRDLERRPSKANPIRAFQATFDARNAVQALFFSTFPPYIEGAGSPAMEINCRRNKPFGPGGSTRRLHQNPKPVIFDGFWRGRNRIDEGVKGVFFLGMVPPLSGDAIVANDNYAPVAQAA